LIFVYINFVNIKIFVETFAFQLMSIKDIFLLIFFIGVVFYLNF